MPYRILSPVEKQQLVESWRSSGLPKTRFAMQSRVSVTAFSRWIAQFAGPAPVPPQSRAACRRTELLPQFVPVDIVDEAVSAPPLVVQLAGCGHRVEVPRGFDVGALKRLVAALC